MQSCLLDDFLSFNFCLPDYYLETTEIFRYASLLRGDAVCSCSMIFNKLIPLLIPFSALIGSVQYQLNLKKGISQQ
jgi:hypothetical protein